MRNLSDYAGKYFQTPFENIQASFRKKKVLEIMKKYSHRNILEIGCGLDPFFNCTDDFDYLTIVEPTVPFYQNAINILKGKRKLTSKVKVVNNYLEESVEGLKNIDFDFIIISCLLHEIEDISTFLKKTRTIMKHKTIVHADVPNANSFHRLLAYEMGLIGSVYEKSLNNLYFQQQRVFDLASFSTTIKDNGFTIVDSGSFFIKPFTHNQMSALLEKNIIDESVLDGLYRMTIHIPDLGSEIYINFKL